MKWWDWGKLSVVFQSLEIAVLIRTKEAHLLRLKFKTKAIDERNTHLTVWDVAKIDVRQSDHHYTDRDKLYDAPKQR